jgi:hypothetical protein
MANDWRRAGLYMAVTFVVTGSARAATHRVPSEYPTIQAGVDVSGPGDSVLVAPGTYTDYETRIQNGLPRSACVFLKDAVVVASRRSTCSMPRFSRPT